MNPVSEIACNITLSMLHLWCTKCLRCKRGKETYNDLAAMCGGNSNRVSVVRERQASRDEHSRWLRYVAQVKSFVLSRLPGHRQFGDVAEGCFGVLNFLTHRSRLWAERLTRNLGRFELSMPPCAGLLGQTRGFLFV